MNIYLDTGNVEEIKKAAELGIDGVTTNPSLIAKEGRDFVTVIKEIVTILKKYSDNFTVSAEVTSLMANEMIKEGEQLSKIDKHVVIKIPLTQEGIKAVKSLSKQGIRTNVTLCFSANQALLAAKAGATMVSPFIGRIDDVGNDGIGLIADIRTIYDNYGFKTKILAASIRHPTHVLDSALAGADIATVPFKVFNQLFHHPLTDLGLASFMADWEAFKKK